MKKFTFFLIAIFFAISNALFAVDYDLWIADVRVSDANQNNITGEGISGDVSYDPMTKTLTLNNATISCTYTDAIYSKIYGLKINVVGTNSVIATSESYNNDALFLTHATTISGNGTLNLVADDDGINWSDILTITNVSLNVTANYGLYGYYAALIINHSTIHIDSYNVAICAESLMMNGVGITEPAGAAFDPLHKTVRLANYAVETLVIEPIDENNTIAYYDLWIADVQVSDTNKNNITGEGISGDVSYDPTTKTLTLNNATIATEYAIAIYSNIPGLTINVVGTNSLLASGYEITTLWLDQATRISGNDTLILGGYCGIYFDNNLFINNVFMNIIADYGIYGDEGLLTINNATIHINSIEYALYSEYLTMNGVGIAEPAGAVFDEYMGTIALNDNLVYDVVIEPMVCYDLWVAGMQVSERNKDSIANADISGNVSYDPTTKTLTLDNATIDCDDNVIYSNISGLTINVVGTNFLSTTYSSMSALYLNRTTTISGNGTLNLENVDDGIYFEKILTINDVAINITDAGHGIFGDASLIINNAPIHIYSNYYSLRATHLTLNGVGITEPAGAVFDDRSRVVSLAGYPVLETLVIEPITEVDTMTYYDLWIAGVRVSDSNKNNITSADISGNVSYNSTTNTLTLDNALIFTENWHGIYSNIPGLTINVVQTSYVSTESYDGKALYLNQKTTISGNDTLNLKSNDDIGIYFNDTLIINDVAVDIMSYDNGVYGNSSLIINNAPMYISNDNLSLEVENLTLNGVVVVEPAGATFNPYWRTVCLSGYEVEYLLKIAPIADAVIAYDLWVAGVQVSDTNKNNITGEGISGNVSYNSTTNTLTLDNAIIFTEDWHGISSYIPGLTINVVGTNSVTTTSSWDDALYLTQAPTISGNGTLNLVGDDDGISSDSPLVINDVSINITAEYGIYLNYNLMINNASIHINSSYMSLRADSLVMNGVGIVEPIGAAFNSNMRTVCVGGVTVSGTLIIAPMGADETPSGYYDLWVAGLQVSDSNKNNITGEGISGNVSYDPTTNTLTLDNATISSENDGNAIYSSIPGLTINVVGINYLLESYHALYLNQTTTISGSGTLNIEADDGIFFDDTLVISNTLTTIDVWGEGIYGYGHLIINAPIYINCNDVSLLANSLTLNGVGIIEPVGAAFNTNWRAVCLRGREVLGTLIIDIIDEDNPQVAYYDLWIAGEQVSDYSKNNITGAGIFGGVSYDPTINTLTLNNTMISYEGGDVIYSNVPGLTINVVGTNYISILDDYDHDYDALYLDQATTISGSGSLILDAGEDGIYTESPLIINDVSMNITALYGIYVTNNLMINNASIYILSNEVSLAADSLMLNSAAIVEPVGAYFDPAEYTVIYNGEMVADELIILPIYEEDVIAACVNYEWHDVIYTVSGTYQIIHEVGGKEMLSLLDLTINALPEVAIVQEENTLIATAGMASYLWNTNETTESITISELGTYSVTATDANGCANNAEIIVTELPETPVDPETAIADAAAHSVNIYPNPAHDVLHVRADGFQTLEIINFLGQVVYCEPMSTNELRVNVANLTAGTYFVRLKGNETVVTEKFIRN